ncbi:MAG: glycosyltransferase 87 family protein, partial [Thermoplasmatota archaeon]
GFGEGKAVLGSLLFLANPVTIYSTFQDEGIIVFTILVSLYFIYHEREKLASLTIGLGFITKIWSGFLIPAQLFLWDIDLKKRVIHMAISIATGLALLALFVQMWGEKTLWFVGFYGGGASKSTVGGVSIWAYLAETSLISKTAFPATIVLGILAAAEIVLLIYAYRKKIDLLQFYTCSLALFLIIYPKVHWEYYLMIFPPLVYYAVRERRFLWGYWGLSFLLLGARGMRDLGSYPDGLALAFAMICSIGAALVLLYIFREILTDPTATKIPVNETPKE